MNKKDLPVPAEYEQASQRFSIIWNDYVQREEDAKSEFIREKWYNFSFVLRKKNRILFEEMLQSSYLYSSSINAKGREYSTESLFMTLIFEKYKKIIFNPNHHNYQQQPLFK